MKAASEAPKKTEPDFDLAAFVEGDITQTTQEETNARAPTPARRPMDFWEQQQEEYERDKARDEAAAAAAAAEERRRAKMKGRMTAKEMLKQLERLKQVD